jgi:hypothetical protein
MGYQQVGSRASSHGHGHRAVHLLICLAEFARVLEFASLRLRALLLLTQLALDTNQLTIHDQKNKTKTTQHPYTYENSRRKMHWFL